jgi:hypothetical protein
MRASLIDELLTGFGQWYRPEARMEMMLEALDVAFARPPILVRFANVRGFQAGSVRTPAPEYQVYVGLSADLFHLWMDHRYEQAGDRKLERPIAECFGEVFPVPLVRPGPVVPAAHDYLPTAASGVIEVLELRLQPV